jgi:hypothetical protein
MCRIYARAYMLVKELTDRALRERGDRGQGYMGGDVLGLGPYFGAIPRGRRAKRAPRSVTKMGTATSHPPVRMLEGMEPYVVRQGDFVDLLAHNYGFDADDVWNDSANDDLRQNRDNPNVLYPTDVLYIPSPPDPASVSLQTGTTNTFVSDVPTVPVQLRFDYPDLASQAFTIDEIPELTGLLADGDGIAKFEVPINIGDFTVTFTSSGTSFAFVLGNLDPVGTLSGIFQRLQNLGYIPREVDVDTSDLEPLRRALQRFRDYNMDPDDALDADSPLPPAYGGLDDDGNLDPKVAQLLTSVHGS